MLTLNLFFPCLSCPEEFLIHSWGSWYCLSRRSCCSIQSVSAVFHRCTPPISASKFHQSSIFWTLQLSILCTWVINFSYPGFLHPSDYYWVGRGKTMWPFKKHDSPDWFVYFYDTCRYRSFRLDWLKPPVAISNIREWLR